MKYSTQELATSAFHQAELEKTVANVEALVAQRTEELSRSKEQVLAQQETLISSSKLSALGQMAAGVAHEINTPLAVLSARFEQMDDYINEDPVNKEGLKKCLQIAQRTERRIAKIIEGLRFYSRQDRLSPFEKAKVAHIVEETLGFCQEKFNSHGVQFELIAPDSFSQLEINCRPVEISQVILNLLNNAYDAIRAKSEKWIRLYVAESSDNIEVSIVDSGTGIPRNVQDHLMEPFFTTKEAGKGTGLGLSISKGIIENHAGRIFLDSNCPNTKFTIQLPKNGREAAPTKEVA